MDETPRPSAAALLAAFFARSPVLAHPSVRGHAGEVRRHLEVYLDTDYERFLTPSELVLAGAERELDPAGAVARVTDAEALVAGLPGFVDDAWLMPGVPRARAQLFLVLRLVEWLVGAGHVDRTEMACFLLDVEAAVVRARRDLRDAGAPRRTRATR
ncbi:MAG: hypothetical protein ACYC1Z_12040 [Georgenia sp.]